MRFLIVTAVVLCAYADATMLGQNRCTWGPAYWCDSLGNAKECTAMEHCKVRVWKTSKFEGKKNDELCNYCKDSVDQVRQMLENKDNIATVRQYMEQVCAQIPFDDAATDCKKAVDEYLPEIIDMIVQELNPNVICQQLGLCGTRKSMVPMKAPRPNPVKLIKPVQLLPSTPIKPSKVGDSAQCVLCEFVMDKLEGLLSSNATEQEILDALEKVCSILPGTIKDQCDSFVTQYGPAIINVLTTEVTPKMVCTAIGLCGITDKQLYMPKEPSPEECGTCKLIVNYMDTMLQKPQTEKEIRMMLEKICNFVPTEYSAMCKSAVDQYEPALIQLLLQQLDPSRVCKELQMCPTGGKPVDEDKIVPLKYIPLGKHKPVRISTLEEVLGRGQ